MCEILYPPFILFFYICCHSVHGETCINTDNVLSSTPEKQIQQAFARRAKALMDHSLEQFVCFSAAILSCIVIRGPANGSWAVGVLAIIYIVLKFFHFGFCMCRDSGKCHRGNLTARLLGYARRLLLFAY